MPYINIFSQRVEAIATLGTLACSTLPPIVNLYNRRFDLGCNQWRLFHADGEGGASDLPIVLNIVVNHF